MPEWISPKQATCIDPPGTDVQQKSQRPHLQQLEQCSSSSRSDGEGDPHICGFMDRQAGYGPVIANRPWDLSPLRKDGISCPLSCVAGNVSSQYRRGKSLIATPPYTSNPRFRIACQGTPVAFEAYPTTRNSRNRRRRPSSSKSKTCDSSIPC